MRKKVFIWLMFGCTILWFLFFELFILKTIGRNIFDDSKKFEASVHVRDFLQQAPGLQERLFLIDKNVLKEYHEMVTENRMRNDSCVFCNVKKFQPVSFALLCPSNISLEEHILLPVLKAWELGFWVENIVDSVPKKFSIHPRNLPLGFILQKGGGAVVIEIVLLHEREGDFWWHGSIHQDAQYKLKLSNLKILDMHKALVLNKQGALEKFHFESVVIDENRLNVPTNVPLFIKESSEFVECNYEQADKFYKAYGKDTTARALRFVHKVQKALSVTKAVLDQLEIPFWISSGTLLGYYRQCDVIPYSQDVDIGVFIKDFNESLIEGLQSRNMKLKHKFGRVNEGLELSFVINLLKLDIFFFYEDGNSYWNGGHSLVYKDETLFSGVKFRYTFPKFTLCWTEFLDMKLRIPCQTETYIRANYGPDWFKPMPKWHWNESPFNVKKVGVWSPSEIKDVIRIY